MQKMPPNIFHQERYGGARTKIKSGLRSSSQTVMENNDQKTPEQLDRQTERTLAVKNYNLQHEFDKEVYTSQTRKCPCTSYKDNQYVMMGYNINGSGGIVAELMRSRSTSSMIEAYEDIVSQMPQGEERPTLHILDNVCIRELNQAITDNTMAYQLVLPHDHHRNAAEKAIQIFEDHFVAVLCGIDPDFPMRLWCALLPQATIQLNMMRPSATKQLVSAFEHIHVPHNYDKHPFAILSSAVEIHVALKNRATWGEHTVPGFYLGQSWEHYRCYDLQRVGHRNKSNQGRPDHFFRRQHIT